MIDKEIETYFRYTFGLLCLVLGVIGVFEIYLRVTYLNNPPFLFEYLHVLFFYIFFIIMSYFIIFK
jgi:hypothetical protein